MLSRRTFAFLALMLLMSTTLFSSCSRAPSVWPNMPGKKKVLASFAPIYCFAKAVAGDDANVLCLLTIHGPHASEESLDDVKKVREADLILCNGLGLDEEQLKKRLGKAKVPIVEIGEAVEEKYPLRHLDHDEKGKHDHGKDDHEHGEHDPHVWLHPLMAMVMVDKIAEELSRIDPARKEGFHKRAAVYKAKLAELHNDGLARFKLKKNRNLVAQHDSLFYFAQAFGLNVIGHLRTQAGDEGSLVEEAELIKLCKKEHPAAITIEPQFAGKKSQLLQKTLEREKIHAKLVEVDPIETAPLAEGSANPDPGYYLKRMYENLDNLDKALP